ncbi:MAG: 50S ribosomal protein L3 [bacterium]|nr:50S ribosomal protein L3 [bacterium]
MSNTKGGLIVSKQEMTKMWIDDKFIAVTLVKLLPQEIIRYKTNEKDGYVAAVVGVEKKELKKEKGQKIVYGMVTEFPVSEDFVAAHQVGEVLDTALLDGVTSLTVTGFSKGKGFQGMVKRCNIKGGPATHGHKFTRSGGSKGNRKPRRTMKGHPHAGHMGAEKLTVKRIPLLKTLDRDGEKLLIVKGSLPGAKNSKLKFFVE